MFIIVDEGLIDQPHAAWSGVITREIPVTPMLRDGIMESFHTLKDQFNRCCHTLRAQHLNDFSVDFINGEGLIDSPNGVFDWVLCVILRFLELLFACLIDLFQQMFHTPFTDKRYRCTEDTELFQTWHVDTVIVRIAYLGCAGDHNYLLRVQPIEDTKDAFLQCCTTNDGVINDDKVVLIGLNALVSDVIDVRSEVLSGCTLRDKRAQLDVFPCHFL